MPQSLGSVLRMEEALFMQIYTSYINLSTAERNLHLNEINFPSQPSLDT